MIWMMLISYVIMLGAGFAYAGFYYAAAAHMYRSYSDSGMYYSRKHFWWFSIVLGMPVFLCGYIIVTAGMRQISAHIIVNITSLLWVILILGMSIRQLGQVFSILHTMDTASFWANLFRAPEDDDLTIGMEELYNHEERAWVVFLRWLWEIVQALSAGGVFAVFILFPGPWKVLVILCSLYFIYNAGKGFTSVIRWRMRSVTFH